MRRLGGPLTRASPAHDDLRRTAADGSRRGVLAREPAGSLSVEKPSSRCTDTKKRSKSPSPRAANSRARLRGGSKMLRPTCPPNWEASLSLIGLHRIFELGGPAPSCTPKAIADAVAHRSYKNSTGHRFALTSLPPPNFVLQSPSPPDPVTVENIREAQAARNPRVISVLRRLRLAEDSELWRGRNAGLHTLEPARITEYSVDTGRFRINRFLPVRGSITPHERRLISTSSVVVRFSPPIACCSSMRRAATS